MDSFRNRRENICIKSLLISVLFFILGIGMIYLAAYLISTTDNNNYEFYEPVNIVLSLILTAVFFVLGIYNLDTSRF